MADTILPVQLNKGLDLVTTPLLVQEGALIDCLNYELTDIAGYRRIDGYEAFDGYPDGGIGEYFQITLVATNPANQSLIVPGSVITVNSVAPPGVDVVGDPLTEDVGVILASMGSNIYRYVPFESVADVGAGTAINIRTPAGTTFAGTSTTNPVDGRDLGEDVQTYAANLRTYSSVLRSLVAETPTSIAGLWRLDNEVFAAIDARSLIMVVNDAFNGPYPVAGMLIRHKGTIYRVLSPVELPRTLAPVPGEVALALQPVATNGAVSNNVEHVSSNYTTISVIGSSANDTTQSDYAYVVKFNRPRTSSVRGVTALAPIVGIPFDAGSYALEALPLNSAVTIKNTSGGSIQISGIIQHVQIDSGSFPAGTAAGTMYIALAGTAVNGSMILDNYVIHLGFSTYLANVNAFNPHNTILGVKLAGTAMLNRANTRYVSIQANFTGSLDTRAAYVATGTTRAGVVTSNYYGNVVSNPNEDADIPKYVACHVGKLALGFAQGSVILSVQGEPLNYSGVQGAIEIATGDPVTGLLEMPGETLAVFGKRAIRKITGFTDTDTTLGSLAAGSSCFDYTAVLVGQTAVYTGVHGITSLEQSASYGDFVGQRLSDRISVWLRPKLVYDTAKIETGGVVCAIPVRAKQQYRLFLKTGDVVSCTLTEEGPRIMLSRYGLGGDILYPYAWTSDTDDDGQEMIHVRWDATGRETETYTLDRGWGFNGQYFNHYFDMAHVFNKSGSQFMGVERARLYGQGYGIATLNIKSAGIEGDFDQDFHEAIQDISMPATPYVFYDRMQPVMSIVDQANWGVGVKLRIQNTTEEGSAVTEPSHICQVFVLHNRTEGAGDN